MFSFNVQSKQKSIEKKPHINNVFNEEDVEEQEVSDPKAFLLKQQEEQSRKARDSQQKNLEEDPNVYDFDSFYDEMKQEQAKKDQQRKEEKKKQTQSSKYIDALKKVAEQRKWERELNKDRQAIKNIEKEKEIYGDTESFVTSSYLKKIEERKKWEEDQKKKEELEKQQHVTKKGMSGFYTKLVSNLTDDTPTQAPSKAHTQIEAAPKKRHRSPPPSATATKNNTLPKQQDVQKQIQHCSDNNNYGERCKRRDNCSPP
ncbi:nuclear speckle splicing regulatory protein NSRP1, partial [Acrasis kona]